MLHMKPQRLSLYPLICLLLSACFIGCAGHNPFIHAKTPLDKAHVTLRSFEIVQMEVLPLVNDESIAPAMQVKLKTLSHNGTLASEQLGGAVTEVEAARAELTAGTTTSERLATANANLVQWTTTLQARIDSIKAAQKEARHHD